MTSRLPSKTVLITGCSAGGIGDALAQSFNIKGHRVFATARNLAKVEHLKEMDMTIILLDVLNISFLNEVVKAVSLATGGTLDMLINNSGIGYSTPILDADLDYARKLFEINFFGRVITTQAFSALLINRTASSSTSVESIQRLVQVFTNASCAAVNLWSDTLRLEMESFDVKVILVITGAVNSHFLGILPTKRLVEDSIYAPAKDIIEAAMNGSIAGNRSVRVEKYAEQVIANALRKTLKKR